MKKAQTSGTGAAILIMIIAVLLVVYILLIPPAEREKLLEGESGVSGVSYANKTLLLTSPGRLDYLAQDKIEHPISTVSLYSTTSASLLKSVSTIYIKNAWFDKKPFNFSFMLDDLTNTDNVLLGFNVNDCQGMLIIKLNGFEIFNSEITTLNTDPIKLPKDQLKKENVLEFEVSPVGFKFWGVNEYSLEKIRVSADVTDITTREAKQTFLVTTTEKENAEKMILRFFSDCKPAETGILNIYLNGHSIFSAAPDCGILRTLEIAPTSLISGENELHFQTNKGAYVIDSIMLKTELKEMTYPTYYFEVEDDTYSYVSSGDFKLRLRMEFPDDVEQKKADIYVNGHLNDLYTTQRVYELTLNPFINSGNNVIEIKPKSTLDVVNLKVEFV